MLTGHEHDLAFGMSLPAAAALGALHVFEPAHGRSIVHALIVGSRRCLGDVLAFGAVVLITHTTVALALALAAGLFGAEMAEHGLTPLARLLGSLLTLYVGIRMWMHGRRHTAAHRAWEERHVGCVVNPQNDVALSPVALGFTGGLVPCYGSVALIGVGAATGHPFRAVMPVIAFGVGLSLTLTAAGMLSARIASSNRIAALGSGKHWADYVGAGIVIALGAVSGVLAIIEAAAG